jgi:hypothetical protein
VFLRLLVGTGVFLRLLAGSEFVALVAHRVTLHDGIRAERM